MAGNLQRDSSQLENMSRAISAQSLNQLAGNIDKLPKDIPLEKIRLKQAGNDGDGQFDATSPTSSFNFVIEELKNQSKASVLLLCAIFIPYLFGWFFSRYGLLFGLAGCTAIFLVLHSIWRRDISTYKSRVRAELERLRGLQAMESTSESTEWLNVILSRFWLIFEPVLSESIVSSVNPVLETFKPGFIDDIALTEFTLGTASPRLVAIRGNPRTESDIIRFDVDCAFQPLDGEDLDLAKGERNSKIVLMTRIGKGMMNVGVPVSVKEVGFSGTVCLQLRTMAGFPYVKAFSMAFTEKPKISFVLKPLNGVDLMDLPGLNNFITKLIDDVVCSMFLSPNVFTIDLDAMMNGNSNANEVSIGVLTLRLYEAKELKNLEAIGFSDPYCAVKLGGKAVAKSQVILNNLHPYWNETFYILVKSFNDILELQVLDKDLIKDKTLGYFKSPLKELGIDASTPHMNDVWKPLVFSKDHDHKVKRRGQIRFELQYYPAQEPLAPQMSASTQDLASSQTSSSMPGASISKTGILRISLHQAKELDMSKSLSGHYSCFVDVAYNGVEIHRTRTKKRTNIPAWEETIELFVRNIDKDKIKFSLFDQREMGHNVELGDFEVLLRELVSSQQKSIEWWSLRNAVTGKLRVTFKYTPVPIDHVVPALSERHYVPAIGTLRLKVIEGRGLKNMEAVGISDPYVLVNYSGKSVAKTQTINENLDPLWNETFYILLQDSSLRGSVNFEVYDFNQLQKDRLMGKASFDLKRLLESGQKTTSDPKVFDMDLTNDGKLCGSLKIELSYHPIDAKDIKMPQVEGSTASPQDMAMYEAGIVRMELHQLELDPDALSDLKYSEISKPSPYMEFFDVASSIFTNDIAKLTESDGAKSKSSTFAHTIRSLAKAEPEDPVDLVFRTPAQKKTFLISEMNEVLEFFVRDFDSARLLVVLKDFENSKQLDQDEGKGVFSEVYMRHPLLGKNDLFLKSLIENRQSHDEKSEWFSLYSLAPKDKPIIGKFRIAVSFSPVKISPQLLISEYEIEASEKGSLTLELVEGWNLPAVDSSGTSDPFCTVRLNNEKVFKSKVIKKNNKSPQWNETTSIAINRRSTTRLVIECRDWNKFEENKLLGVFDIDCSKLVIGKTVESIEKLRNEEGAGVVGADGQKSTIRIRYTFVPDERQLTRKSRFAKQRVNVLSKVGSVVGTAVGGAVGGAIGGAIGTSVAAITMAGKLVAKTKKAQKSKSSDLALSESESETNPASLKSPESKEAHAKEQSVDVKPIVFDTLAVKIIKASSLKSKDPDAMVKVKLKKGSGAEGTLQKKPSFMSIGSSASFSKSHTETLFKTKIIKKNSNPVWDESFVLPFDILPQSADCPSLVFSIRDHNIVGGSSSLGEYCLNISEIFSSTAKEYGKETVSVDFETRPGDLMPDGGNDATLTLRLDFYPKHLQNPSTAPLLQQAQLKQPIFGSLTSLKSASRSSLNEKQ